MMPGNVTDFQIKSNDKYDSKQLFNVNKSVSLLITPTVGGHLLKKKGNFGPILQNSL